MHYDDGLEQRTIPSDGAARLEGIPFGLKDIIATAAIPSTGGSSLYLDHIPTETAATDTPASAATVLIVTRPVLVIGANSSPRTATLLATRFPQHNVSDFGGS